MKRIITPDFQIISEPVDSDHEDDWPTLLKVFKQALALYDQADLNRRKRLRRPKATNASTTTPKSAAMNKFKTLFRK